MGGEAERVIVDTYAIIADLTAQAARAAARVLERVRLGQAVGVVHYLIVYELAYHWRRGRLPFRGGEELLEFVSTYFRVKELDTQLALRASKVKVLGDRLLAQASSPALRRRRLSSADAATIALAENEGAPVVTGDADLSYVARKLGVQVIW